MNAIQNRVSGEMNHRVPGKFGATCDDPVGVKIEGQFWTLGAYDGVLILSADSEQKVLHCLSQLAGLGNVRTETMQAFIDKEFEEIVGT